MLGRGMGADRADATASPLGGVKAAPASAGLGAWVQEAEACARRSGCNRAQPNVNTN